MSVVHQLEFPRDIATLLQLRGNSLLPLQLQDGSNRGAKLTLDNAASDSALFTRRTVTREPMAAAARGLLYLWNGWLDECNACGERSDDPERYYLAALVARQQANSAEAKQFHQQVNGHEIYAQLSLDVETMLGETTDSALRRLQQLLKMDQNWEPYAFVDLYEQCRRRVLPAGTERIVRQIQIREIELLLVYTVEGALSERLPPLSKPLDELAERKVRERERRRQRTEEEHRARKSRPSPERSSSPAAAPAAVAAPPDLKIKCPKCKITLSVPVTHRGKKTSCSKCSTAFLVPSDKSMTMGVAPPPAGSIGVHCPKCQHVAVIPPGNRGKAHDCEKCAATFLIPK